MLAILPILLLAPQINPQSTTYDVNGNPLQAVPGTSAPGDILNSFSAGSGLKNSGAAADGATLMLTDSGDGAAVIYLVNEATGASLGTVSTVDPGDFGLGYDSTRGLYITTNAGTDVVSTFDGSGSLVSTWAAPSAGPVGAAYDASRDVYWISDWTSNTVSSISPVTGAVISTFDTSAVGCTRPAGAAYDAASDQVIVGGRDQNALFFMDASSGALASSFSAVDGTNNPQGLASSNSGHVWQTSWNSSTVFELEAGGAPGLTLAISGTCPGAMTLTVNGATASGTIAIAYGTPGAFTIPSGPCAGLVLDIGPSVTLAGMFGASASGDLTLNFNGPAGGCGATVQAVDLSSCTKSNTDTL